MIVVPESLNLPTIQRHTTKFRGFIGFKSTDVSADASEMTRTRAESVQREHPVSGEPNDGTEPGLDGPGYPIFHHNNTMIGRLLHDRHVPITRGNVLFSYSPNIPILLIFSRNITIIFQLPTTRTDVLDRALLKDTLGVFAYEFARPC